MKKLGKVLLLILNICIDTFLLMIVLLLLLWAIFGVNPGTSIQNAFIGIQYAWDSLWGIEPQKDASQLSPKFQKRAHRHIYVVQPNKRDEDIVTQPYKQEK